MKNKLSYLIIIAGFIALLTLIPGVIDGSIYYYYRIKNGSMIEFDNNCFSVPDGWVKTTRDIDNSGYSFLEFDQEKNEIILVSKVNKVFLDRVHSSALLEQISIDLYRINEKYLSNNETRYWLIIPQYDLIVGGREIPITESFARSLQSINC
jgi:hypothetical protein